MTDLFLLFSKLVTPKGEILIPGINEMVRTTCLRCALLLPKLTLLRLSFRRWRR